METTGFEPASPRCKRGTLPIELRPREKDANGWSRTTTAQAGGFTGRGARRCSAFAQKRAADRARTGSARITTSDAAAYTTATMSGDGRIRTGDVSADNRALWPAELRPRV